ncbi:hypothetical protein MIN45_P0865 [Methylomarinovum tepidoasis]|uniref:DUF2281 domain-containing protein n=1 Tax=Methylomarinovum tepidoasis TaxID=2840183 RepID=A0AAU9C9F4_9GAMM|nr:hypothetical protein [Methylomarinovum sp. IN45]BCX88496.1 hypothetical protein MIN45_P0865 [Methylomarinovum sp. IN45]
MCRQETAERIREMAQELPEEDAIEVLKFIEYLRFRRLAGEDETTYLLREPANRRRLLEAVENIRKGRDIEAKELLPDD